MARVLSDICEPSCYIMLTQRPFALGQEVRAAAAASLLFLTAA